MDKLKIIKIGGKMLDDAAKLNRILDVFAKIKGPKILVHGGASRTDFWLKKMGVEPNMVAGRRITDQQTLEVCVMVYAGILNKQLVANLSQRGVSALGMSGADLNSIRCTKRSGTTIDYGYVGDLEVINTTAIIGLLNQNIAPVFSAITHDNNGQLLNTNGDTIAAGLAEALTQNYNVELQFVFDRDGVVKMEHGKETVIEEMDSNLFAQMLANEQIKDGLIPKLQNGFKALDNGIERVTMGSPDIMIDGSLGTKLVKS